jgi:site-specific DNA-methyltransferase (adenine-specific)
MKLNKIYQGDCIEVMKTFPDNSIDLTVTSPPYDNLRDYKGYTFNFEEIAKELFRITKDSGVVVWVIGDATIKGSETGTSFKQALYFKEIGFNLHDTMIWRKTTPVPQFKCNRYTASFEYMFIFSKGKPICNYLTTKCKTVGKKKNRNNKGSFSLNSTDRPRDEITTTKENKILDNVWEYSVGGHKDMGHPAIFPEQLANDHILSWSNEGDIVLDPMCGSGTTCKMAKLNNRNYIGIEIAEEYCKIAEERINNLSKESLILS